MLIRKKLGFEVHKIELIAGEGNVGHKAEFLFFLPLCLLRT